METMPLRTQCDEASVAEKLWVHELGLVTVFENCVPQVWLMIFDICSSLDSLEKENMYEDLLFG